MVHDGRLCAVAEDRAARGLVKRSGTYLSLNAQLSEVTCCPDKNWNCGEYQ